jgi:hypothetical protein
LEEINTLLVCISCWLIVSYPFESDFSSFVFQVLTAGQKLQFYLYLQFCVECKRKRIGTTLLSISLILHSKSVTDEEVLDYNTGHYTSRRQISLQFQGMFTSSPLWTQGCESWFNNPSAEISSTMSHGSNVTRKGIAPSLQQLQTYNN